MNGGSGPNSVDPHVKIEEDLPPNNNIMDNSLLQPSSIPSMPSIPSLANNIVTPNSMLLSQTTSQMTLPPNYNHNLLDNSAYFNPAMLQQAMPYPDTKFEVMESMKYNNGGYDAMSYYPPFNQQAFPSQPFLG